MTKRRAKTYSEITLAALYPSGHFFLISILQWTQTNYPLSFLIQINLRIFPWKHLEIHIEIN